MNIQCCVSNIPIKSGSSPYLLIIDTQTNTNKNPIAFILDVKFDEYFTVMDNLRNNAIKPIIEQVFRISLSEFVDNVLYQKGDCKNIRFAVIDEDIFDTLMSDRQSEDDLSFIYRAYEYGYSGVRHPSGSIQTSFVDAQSRKTEYIEAQIEFHSQEKFYKKLLPFCNNKFVDFWIAANTKFESAYYIKDCAQIIRNLEIFGMNLKICNTLDDLVYSPRLFNAVEQIKVFNKILKLL
jgi:hypothetical protein